LVARSRWRTHTEARMAVFDFIEGFYNPRRRHSALGGISPGEYERRCLNRQEEESIDKIDTTRAA
ncbi:MAG TPA: IS3 family transposase, partial [Gemmatimonadales bacterium]|nr:IS3 family transposase [Gemmatimonadales bacterium]